MVESFACCLSGGGKGLGLDQPKEITGAWWPGRWGWAPPGDFSVQWLPCGPAWDCRAEGWLEVLGGHRPGQVQGRDKGHKPHPTSEADRLKALGHFSLRR